MWFENVLDTSISYRKRIATTGLEPGGTGTTMLHQTQSRSVSAR
jgi:hypothetical protein